jgi:hypothetical protein
VVAPPPPAASPDLMGGPPTQTPPAPAESPATEMAPIANPEDMTPEERERVYGRRYDHPVRHGRHDRLESTSPAEAPAMETAEEHHQRSRRDQHFGHPRSVPSPAGAPIAGGEPHPLAGGAPSPVPSPPVSATVPAPNPPAASVPPAAPRPAPGPATSSPAAPDKTAATPGGLPDLNWLGVPGKPFLNVPGLGHVASRYVTAGILVLLALIVLLIAAARGRAVNRQRRRAPANTIGTGPRFADERDRNMGPPRF